MVNFIIRVRNSNHFDVQLSGNGMKQNGKNTFMWNRPFTKPALRGGRNSNYISTPTAKKASMPS